MFDCTVKKRGKKLGWFHGKQYRNHAGSMELVDPTVFVVMFPILVGPALAYLDSR